MEKFFVLLWGGLLLLCCACSERPLPMDADLKDAMKELELVFVRQNEIAQNKESRISGLKALARSAGEDGEKYRLLDDIFHEYLFWDCDSALFYAHLKENLALRLSSPGLLCEARTDLAHRYVISGMYRDAMSLLSESSAQAHAASQKVIRHRNYLLYEIFHDITLRFHDKYSESEFKPLEAQYLSEWSNSLDESDIDYYNVLSKEMIRERKCGQLITILREKVNEAVITPYESAALYYWIAKAYETAGDDRNAFLYYAVSARNDLEAANRQYRSLVRVAEYCAQYNRTEQAYRYITQSHRDALICDARLRLDQISGSLFSITDSYERQLRQRKNNISVLNTLLIVLLTALLVIAGYLVHNLKKLRIMHQQLNQNFRDLWESNRIKDTYISQFLSMFSNHIDSLERYRSRLRVCAKQMDFSVLQQELRADDFIDEERDKLFEIFDKTFLGLFPEFVSSLNALLRPSEKVGRDLPPGTLNNELRVAALIRLGITDSKRIAKFLKLSPSTVFNYRVKFRNATILGRDTFEEHLAKIV